MYCLFWWLGLIVYLVCLALRWWLLVVLLGFRVLVAGCLLIGLLVGSFELDLSCFLLIVMFVSVLPCDVFLGVGLVVRLVFCLLWFFGSLGCLDWLYGLRLCLLIVDDRWYFGLVVVLQLCVVSLPVWLFR